MRRELNGLENEALNEEQYPVAKRTAKLHRVSKTSTPKCVKKRRHITIPSYRVLSPFPFQRSLRGILRELVAQN